MALFYKRSEEKEAKEAEEEAEYDSLAQQSLEALQDEQRVPINETDLWSNFSVPKPADVNAEPKTIAEQMEKNKAVSKYNPKELDKIMNQLTDNFNQLLTQDLSIAYLTDDELNSVRIALQAARDSITMNKNLVPGQRFKIFKNFLFVAYSIIDTSRSRKGWFITTMQTKHAITESTVNRRKSKGGEESSNPFDKFMGFLGSIG